MNCFHVENYLRTWLSNNFEKQKPKEKQKRKPLLAWGPLASGKKTLIRKVLKEKGFVVWEPTSTDLEQHVDHGIRGKHAFLMRMCETGVKTLPNVVNAPVIYVTDNPYQYKLSKAELESRFQLYNLKSNFNFEQQQGTWKDRNLSVWNIVNQINECVTLANHNETLLEKKISLADCGDDFLMRIVHQSLPTASKDIQEFQEATFSLSNSDLIAHWTPHDYAVLGKVLIPMQAIHLKSNELVLTEKSEKMVKKEKWSPDHFDTLGNVLFEKEKDKQKSNHGTTTTTRTTSTMRTSGTKSKRKPETKTKPRKQAKKNKVS